MSAGKQCVTYVPDNALRKGYATLAAEIVRELAANRWLIWQLGRRDLIALYKQSFAGLAWAVLVPLVSVGSFMILYRAGIVRAALSDVPYVLYGLCGVMFWQIFAVGVLAATHSLVKAGALVVKINISKKSIVCSSLSQSLLCFAIQAAAVTLLSFCIGHPVTGWMLAAPLLALPLVLATLGAGLIFALLNGIFRDTGFFIAMVMPFLLLLTPILYEAPHTGLLAALSTVNPLYYLAGVPRDLIISGTSDALPGFLIAAVGAVLFFCVCCVMFHLTETRIAERI